MPDEPPRYSIIIAAYNAAAYIRETIESVLAQTEKDWELIVVDDGSTDATPRIVSNVTDDRIALIRQENRGVSAARNAGFAASRGAYVLFLDADDIVFPHALYRLGNTLDEHPEAVLAYGTCTRFETVPPREADARQPLRARPKPSGDALAALLTQCPLLMGAVLARREAIARVHGFDPELPVNEDWAFWCDLAALGPFHYVGRKPVFAYRWHSNGRTRAFGCDPRAGWPALDLMFAREAVQQRFSNKKRARLRRRAEAWTLGVASRELLQNGDWRRARRVLSAALWRDPASLGDWFFLPFAIIGWLPKPARRFLD